MVDSTVAKLADYWDQSLEHLLGNELGMLRVADLVALTALSTVEQLAECWVAHWVASMEILSVD